MSVYKKNFKILTNYKSSRLGGVSQALGNFISYLEESQKKVEIIGIDVQPCDPNKEKCDSRLTKTAQFTLDQVKVAMPTIRQAIQGAGTLEELRQFYKPVTDHLRRSIDRERPDVILINGTYFLPWCLLQAAIEADLPVVCHYHGSISKETENYDEHARKLFLEMEREFNQPEAFYVFPSELARTTIERDVFRQPIERAAVIPNPIPLHFFEAKQRRNKKTVGFVGRWTHVKNFEFIKKLVQYNHRKGGEYDMRLVTNMSEKSKDRTDLGEKAKIISPMSNSRLASFYRNLSVLVSPSYFETYGNVAQEAVAAGTPALVNSNMGVAEIFRRVGLDDFVIEFDSAAGVFENIGQASSRGVSDKVRATVRHLLSPQVVYDKLISVIKPVFFLAAIIEAVTII